MPTDTSPTSPDARLARTDSVTPAGRDGRPVVWAEACAAASGIALSALWLWRLAHFGAPELQANVCATLMLPLAFLMGIVIWAAPARAPLDERTRVAWRSLGFAVLVWWLSSVIWHTLGRPRFSWADALKCLFFPLVLRGVL